MLNPGLQVWAEVVGGIKNGKNLFYLILKLARVSTLSYPGVFEASSAVISLSSSWCWVDMNLAKFIVSSWNLWCRHTHHCNILLFKIFKAHKALQQHFNHFPVQIVNSQFKTTLKTWHEKSNLFLKYVVHMPHHKLKDLIKDQLNYFLPQNVSRS